METGSGCDAVLKRVAIAPSELVPGTVDETDEDFLSRGKCVITFEDLLSPGNVTAVGEYTLSPADVSDEDRAAAAAAKDAREQAIAKAKGGKAGAKPAAKPAAAPAKGKPGVVDAAPAPEVNVLTSSGSVLSVSLVLDEPITLVPPTPPPVTLKPEDIIAPRPSALKVPPGLPCSEQFREDVAFVVHSIAEQYVKISKEVVSGASGDIEAKRKALMTALNNSGQYHALKERLKRSAVRIVRERFHKTELQTEAEYLAAKDAFVAELYTYLIGQAHRAMHDAFAEATVMTTGVSGESFTASRAAGVSGSVTSLLMATTGKPDSRIATDSKDVFDDVSDELDRLARIAKEAQHIGDFKKASKCLQSRIALCEKLALKGLSAGGYNAEPWFDYGAFAAKQGDFTKAGECLREAVAIQAKHLQSLLLLGCLSSQLGDHSAASVLLTSARDTAVASGVSATLAHILLAVAEERAGNVASSAESISAAVASHRSSGAALIKPIVGNSTVDTVVAPSEPYLLAATYLLDAGLLVLAEGALTRASACLAEQSVPKDVRIALLVAEARLLLAQSQLSLADARLDSAFEYGE